MEHIPSGSSHRVAAEVRHYTRRRAGHSSWGAHWAKGGYIPLMRIGKEVLVCSFAGVRRWLSDLRVYRAGSAWRLSDFKRRRNGGNVLKGS